jgi:DegV family protein with EDD domain
MVTDSAAALPADLVARHEISIVPMRIENGERVSTSAPTPGDFERAIRAQLERGAATVLVVTLTSALSASCQSATVAAREFGERARVVDSGTAAGGQALVVLAAAEARANGASLDTVAGAAEAAARRVRLVGAVPDLSHLVRSGRVPAVAGWAGRKLGVSPLFELRDGRVHRLRPARSRGAAVDRMIDHVRRSREPAARLHVVALHARAGEGAAAMLARVDAELEPATALVAEFGPVMVIHTGPGILGLAWWWET